MSNVWVAFICGFFLGGVLGMGLLAILVVSRDDDDFTPRMGPPRMPR